MPSLRPDKESGLLPHEEAAAPSKAHVTEVAAGSAEKSMLAEVEFVGLAGATTTGTLGAVRSTIQVFAEDAELPAASNAETVSECEPSAKPLCLKGLVQSTAVCPSTAQVYRTTDVSVSPNVALTDVALVGEGGGVRLGAAGATVSMRQL